MISHSLARVVLACLLSGAGSLAVWGADPQPVKQLILPGESFLLDGRPAFILWPDAARRQQPQPWILYAPTLGGLPDKHEQWMHEQFLAAGVAVAGIDVGEAYGSPQGQTLLSALYRQLTEQRGFARRPCLLGRSRGGLWVSSWAIAHPERVAGIAGIYPVFDLRSYPGLQRAAPAYGLTPEQLEEQLARHNPVARLDVLAKAKVPVCIIHGDVDKVVPLPANSQALQEQYRQAGAADAVQLIVAPGQGHNYWEGFFRCQALIDFALARARAGAMAKAPAADDAAPPQRAPEPSAFPGSVSDWHGFRRHEFEIAGKRVSVVTPERPAEGRPWVWHGEFFGHKPAPDVALLKRGFHIVYLSVPNLLGSPTAVGHWNDTYRELTTKYQLAAKVALVGLSRGGLYCYNWAAANPECVACIYGDAPVCDFKSWPGGKGQGKGSPRDWQLVLEQYRLADDAAALNSKQNPIDQLAPLARAKVPLLHVYGEADEVVPWNENTGVLATRYRQLGGSIRLIAKPGVGHHPHGLHDPTPIVEFIAQHAAVSRAPATSVKPDPVNDWAATLEASRQIVYKQPLDRELYLHMFEPDGWQATDRRSCFVVIHGGGWSGGEPRRMYPFAAHFAKLGCVGISVQYRLYNPAQGTTVFDCVRDGRSAVRFIRQQAQHLGIDPEKIIVCGGSAGGHLAAGTALFDGVDEPGEAPTVSTMPNALVLLFPVIDTSAAGYGQTKIGDRWQALSPVHQVRGRLPPTLIFHGSADTVTPLAGAIAFRDAMQRTDNRCELDVHTGGKHGYLMTDRVLLLDTLRKTELFLRALQLL